MKTFCLNDLETLLFDALKTKTNEVQRAFHGRGGLYEGFEFLTIDFIDTILYIALFKEVSKELENDVKDIADKLYQTGAFTTVIMQHRYLSKAPSQILFGESLEKVIAIENGLKFELNFLNNQNSGLFFDMKKGREYIKSIAKDKNVLNLFSYTCAFSVYAMSAGANSVVNVDMAKGALTTGRSNHHLNGLDTKKVKFMPYNILKSWSRIKKTGPYDIIIIDPPSFQKGSFAVTKDYEKIIKRLDELANSDCIVLSCLNDPKLTSEFIKEQFKTLAPSFKFVKHLDNMESFKALDEEQSLKNLIFHKESINTGKDWKVIDTNVCPFCKQNNGCQARIPNNDCWCHHLKIPEEIREYIPDKYRMKACVCKECAQLFIEDKGAFIQKYVKQ